MLAKSRSPMLWILATIVAFGGVVQADLVALWQLDEAAGNVVSDSSGNGLDGVLQGAAAIVSDAQRGPVFQQNDVAANYISIADPGGLLNFGATGPHQGSATIMAWVKSNGNWTSHDTVFSQGEWDDGIGLSIKADTSPAGQLWLAGDGTHAVTFRSDVAVPTGSWHHVAATFAYDGTATVVTLYLDGEPTGFAQGNGRIPGRVTAPVGGVSRIGLEDRSGSGSSFRWPFNGSIDDVAVLDAALSGAQIQAAMQGLGVRHGEASNPKPADEADDVIRDVAMSWEPGEFAATHNVYFGTSFEDVNAADAGNPMGVSVSAGQDANTYAPTVPLAFGQTYYWRVDEVNAAPNPTIFKGSVWSFTVEPYAYPVTGVVATASSSHDATTGPAKTIDGSGLNADDLHGTDGGTIWISSGTAPKPAWIQYEFGRVCKLQEMRVWNCNQAIEAFAGLSVKDVTVEYSTDGSVWTTLADAPQFARGPGTPGYASNTTVDFHGAAARYVKLTIHSNWGGLLPQYGLSEVRFYHVPAYAREPDPASGQTDLNPNDVTLSWRAGREAVSHEVYLSDDSNAVAAGTALPATVGDSSYTAGALNLGTTYYWKVNEVNEAASPAAWEGEVWSFSTAGSLAIEDFEDYTDDEGGRIYETWLDGYGDKNSGSTVGHLNAPFAERAVVHGGRQSMPLAYDNTSFKLSEAQRIWPAAQNWATNGADTLTLYFQGNPIGFLETSGGHILMNGTGTDIYGTADQGRFVYKQLSGNGSIIARVDRLDNTDAWAKAGVMIRGSLDAGSSWALGLASPGNGTHFQARLTVGGGATSDTTLTLPATQTSARIPMWLKLERAGDQFNVYYALGEATPATWVANPWNPQTISMTSQVYIGLAVTSHRAGGVTQAEFSNISVTGNVTGSWQSADLGIAQPAGNQPDRFYVTVEDTGGGRATVVNPDPLAVCTGAWTAWDIPLTTLTSAGIKTDRIKRMSIGIGDKDKPASGATGMIFIDDIGYGRAVSQ